MIQSFVGLLTLVLLPSPSLKQDAHPCGTLVGGFLPGVGNEAGPFKLRFSAPVLFQTGTLKSYWIGPLGNQRQFGALERVQGLEEEILTLIMASPAVLAESHKLAEAQFFLNRRMGIKYPPTSG